MPTTELPVSAKHCLRQTCVNNVYVVSTIRRRDDLQALDGLIELVTTVIGDIGRADLSSPGDYETMVFSGDNDGIRNWAELDFRRYDTEEEALEGHQQMVTAWLEMPIGLGTT